MGLRFKKSVRICKGVYINIGKTGSSLSVGERGARYTIHSSGRKTATVGIPGTGISYSVSTGGQKRQYKSREYERRRRVQAERERLIEQRAEEVRINALVVEEYRIYIDLITSLFRECQYSIDWKGIASIEPPFQIGESGPNQIVAEKAYNDYKPSIFEKSIPGLAESHRKKLMDQVKDALDRDRDLYLNWKANTNLAKDVLAGIEEAYLFAIKKYNPFQDLIDFGCDFEIGVISPSNLEVEFKVKSESIMPNISLSLTSTGLISRKKLSKTNYYDILQDYVCGCCIRIARELFSLLPIDTVLINADDTILDMSTGYKKDIVILSVKYYRSGFSNINFDHIDASDFTETFPHNMSFYKTSGFREVKRLEEK